MFVNSAIGSDCNSGLNPDQPLATIAMAMNRIAEDRSGVVMVLHGQPSQPPKKKKLIRKWPPEPDNLNVEWWK